MKTCYRCKASKSLSEFSLAPRNKDGLQGTCKECVNIYNKRRRQDYRSLVFAHYGHQCACCGESQPIFLTIDHVNGGGTQHRREIKNSHLAWWLVQNDFPVGYQILCFNCNSGRQINGGVCPHSVGI